MILLKFEGVFGFGHLLFLIAWIALIVLASIFAYKNQNDEKKIKIFIKVIGILMFIAILLNRIFVTYSDVVINKRENYTWWNLIPNTFCGMSSLIFSLTLIFGKKDNNMLHFILYLGFIGGLITIIYPDFLDSQAFFDVRSITGLLHHGLLVLASFFVLFSKFMRPRMEKWKNLPIGSAFVIVFGVFLMDALGFTKAMQIHQPLLSSLPILSSWYIVGIILIALQTIFILIYEKVLKIK